MTELNEKIFNLLFCFEEKYLKKFFLKNIMILYQLKKNKLLNFFIPNIIGGKMNILFRENLFDSIFFTQKTIEDLIIWLDFFFSKIFKLDKCNFFFLNGFNFYFNHLIKIFDLFKFLFLRKKKEYIQYNFKLSDKFILKNKIFSVKNFTKIVEFRKDRRLNLKKKKQQLFEKDINIMTNFFEKNIMRLNKFLESKILQQNFQIEQIYDQSIENLKNLVRIEKFSQKKKKKTYINTLNFFLFLIILLLLIMKFFIN